MLFISLTVINKYHSSLWKNYLQLCCSNFEDHGIPQFYCHTYRNKFMYSADCIRPSAYNDADLNFNAFSKSMRQFVYDFFCFPNLNWKWNFIDAYIAIDIFVL